MKDKQQTGMTLIELTVVLLVLIALAGLAIPYVSGTSSKALCDATDVSMANIKKVIMDRYYLDTLGNFPTDKGSNDFSLNYLFVKGDGTDDWLNFDPDSQVGWRGPYLQSGLLLDNASSSFKASLLNANYKDSTYVNKVLADEQTVVLDSWGRPFIIQVDTVTSGSCTNWGITTSEIYCARLLSAGRGNGLGLSNADINTPIAEHKQGDDRILYLNVTTPADDINTPCSDY